MAIVPAKTKKKNLIQWAGNHHIVRKQRYTKYDRYNLLLECVVVSKAKTTTSAVTLQMEDRLTMTSQQITGHLFSRRAAHSMMPVIRSLIPSTIPSTCLPRGDATRLPSA